MGCRCLKKQMNQTREEALFLSKEERSDYVIYEYKGKKYHDKKTCWEKDKKGRLIEVLCYT